MFSGQESGFGLLHAPIKICSRCRRQFRRRHTCPKKRPEHRSPWIGRGSNPIAGMSDANSATNPDDSALGAQIDGDTADTRGIYSTLSHTRRPYSGLSPAPAYGLDSGPIPNTFHYDDSAGLLKLLVFLGGNVSWKFLERLREDKVTWGIRGDIQLQHPRNIPVVADKGCYG
ncbi:hypothetical protein N657DRAFT_323633 [Parathielavia appendiculata]|uniref:Uncharacterized protein n=1 Tax=Parathielavia appendiculata TaxID=2587402 RepID=A0AAN6TQU2_9PEZI|nr:hypothetical protein N657DRAFT_323633 [Parathielavia appendiculata]